jgi:(E)-4-hydroxy-3-methylbut-2-enyl-diphosphate synthase
MRMKRRRCQVIKIGKVKIGGNNPVAVQSMAKTFTSDLSATLREINELIDSGCQLVRVAVRDNRDVQVLKKIKKNISIPLIADIHFDKNLAIRAIESGVDKIRLNPGNIYKKNEIREIACAAKQAHIPIRVGVNSGSITRYSILDTRYSKNLAQRMVNCALDYIKLLEKVRFHDIVVSIKGSDILTTIQANEKMARLCDYPLHLGLTATGSSFMGMIKSAIVIGKLLSEGIGDTIRVSLTDRAVQEVKTAFYILEALGLVSSKPEIISCPTCGRCEVNLIKIVNDLKEKLSTTNYQLSTRPMKLAVMGCVVNGPGEAKVADLGVAFGKKQGLLFRKGKPIRKIISSECVDVLLEEISKSLQ